MAVELEQDNICYWHLLGLLLAASEDWRGAREVLEAGASLDDEAWMAELTSYLPNDIPDSNTIGRRETSSTAGVTVTSYASSTHPELPSPASEEASTVTERPIERQIILDTYRYNTPPPAAELLQPLPDHLPPSITERFEHALQLRMTQLSLTELMEGPEGTEEKWVEVFQWFAKRRGPEYQSREICHGCLTMLLLR